MFLHNLTGLFYSSMFFHFLFVFDLLFNLFKDSRVPICWERAVPLAFHLTESFFIFVPP